MSTTRPGVATPPTGAKRWRRPFAAWRYLREPVPREKRDRLAERWAGLATELRTPLQGLGRQATGCGATIGLMPRCDFDCQGCYLGAEANTIPPVGVAAALAQLDTLRAALGPKGNVQITDGEVTLLPEADLIAIVRHARAIGLMPMLMSHGDTLRRQPGLLDRLVVEGGLREISIHVDSLQRGRRGWRERERAGLSEADLMPLRAELANLVRAVRRRTGVRLRAATTLTVARSNLDGVPAVVDWCLHNRDAFGLISFQPLAHVGRTESDLEGVTADELWERIAAPLGRYGYEKPDCPALRFGHPDCTRLEQFAVVEWPDRPPRLEPIVRAGNAEDEQIVGEFLRRGFGGLNFRDDLLLERACKILGLLLLGPRFFFGRVRRYLSRRAHPHGGAGKLALGLLRGKARITSLQVVSHHFMSPAELQTERGRERLDACVFKVPIGDRLVPMCQVNAAGERTRFYAEHARC